MPWSRDAEIELLTSCRLGAAPGRPAAVFGLLSAPAHGSLTPDTDPSSDRLFGTMEVM